AGEPTTQQAPGRPGAGSRFGYTPYDLDAIGRQSEGTQNRVSPQTAAWSRRPLPCTRSRRGRHTPRERAIGGDSLLVQARRLMLARVFSACLAGVEAALVRVEVDVSHGLPVFATVGLPDPAVRESRERVRTAIRNSGFTFPLERVTVNLAPA